jgi:hypothetical protein
VNESDWDHIYRPVAPRPAPPAPELVERCWRFVGPSQRVFECGVYRTAAGLEVRAGYGELELIHSKMVASIDDGRELAAEWKQAVLDKGSFIELS